MKKVKVEILKSVGGLANPEYDLPDHNWDKGDVVELHPTLAAAWIASGIAKPPVPSLEELLRKKLEADLEAPPEPSQIAWTGSERELANKIMAQIERGEIEATDKKQAFLRECRRYYIQRPDLSRKSINPESLWRNYNQQFR